ncbi:MAG: phospholipid/glycerol acyltransferase [Moraxellaceae bacterium]|jgi:1-acyl-sn-glycerol-3-phosphate acyltransferase|nr:phospholipid/glycerol acyltransferase [Moraxellaceae bacterium]
MTDPRLIELGPNVPRRGNAFSRWLSLLILKLLGWRVTGAFPDVRKGVLIVAPHTSNFDGFMTVVASFALGLKISFFVKAAAFTFPFGGFMRWVGALPVNRDNSKNLVAYSAAQLREADQLLISVAPEGTRSTADNWKSGFYWIAHQAELPIIFVAFDYLTKEVRIMGSMMPTGDIDKDMPEIIARYRDIHPRHPERLSGPLRALRDRKE